MAQWSQIKYVVDNTTDSRTYRILTTIYQDPYWEDCYRDWKTGLYPGQKRSYKTWKHNRKTQWKE